MALHWQCFKRRSEESWTCQGFLKLGLVHRAGCSCSDVAEAKRRRLPDAPPHPPLEGISWISVKFTFECYLARFIAHIDTVVSLVELGWHEAAKLLQRQKVKQKQEVFTFFGSSAVLISVKSKRVSCRASYRSWREISIEWGKSSVWGSWLDVPSPSWQKLGQGI